MPVLNRILSGAAALAVAALAATASNASTLNYKADLTGRGEVPANDSHGSGHCDATLDTSNNQLTWECTFTGVSGPLIGAHFHGPVSYVGATSEENAPIQVGTSGHLGNPFRGVSTLDATQAHDLKIGRWYFNMHTQKFPAGEIRGPIVEK